MTLLKLAATTNWDDALIDRLTPYPVVELYGALRETPIGHGQTSTLLPDISKEEAAAHIRRAVDSGMSFNYLIDSPCFGNREYDPSFKEAMLSHLHWVSKQGARAVTVTNPFMLALVKAHLPHLSVTISPLGFVDSVEKARHLSDMGADAIVIDLMSNRDFAFLKEVRRAVDGELRILVNQACLFQCPDAWAHCLANGHQSQNWNDQEDPLGLHCTATCARAMLTDPEAMIKSRWVRPEDLTQYESLQYSTFLIAGREMSTSWIVNAVKAYSEKQYNGNLTDILSAPFTTGAWNHLGEIKPPVVDNGKLAGFLDFFKTVDCKHHCRECPYCRQVADKAVTCFKAENETAVAALTKIGAQALDDGHPNGQESVS